MRAPAAFALVLTLAGIAVGCGEDSPDRLGYGPELDEACLELFEAVNALPGRVRSGELEVSEVQSLGERAEARFVSRVEELDPPPELADRQAELLATFERRDPGDDLESAGSALAALVVIYADLGAGECERLSAEALARFEALGDRVSPG